MFMSWFPKLLKVSTKGDCVDEVESIGYRFCVIKYRWALRKGKEDAGEMCVVVAVSN